MVNTYTLEEAARVLGVSTDEARKQLKKDNVREFQDPSRKTFRYPVQAVDELARRMGAGSDPQVQLGEAGRVRASDSPPPRARIPDDQVDIGAHPIADKPSSKKLGSGSKSPAPRPGSDSDVRLVPEGSDLDFKIAGDSDVRIVDEGAQGPKSAVVVGPDSGVRVGPSEAKSDSDVKIVPDASDSGAVPIHVAPPKRPSDSDIRLQSATGKRASDSDSSIPTEEIDLDAELRKATEEKARKKSKTGRQPPTTPTTSTPYELSEPDVSLSRPPGKKEKDSSDDFVLTPGSPSSSSELELSSSELRKLSSEEEVTLGEARKGAAGDSGINLHDPADSGVSLEKQADSGPQAEYELSLDSGSGPKVPPKEKKVKKEDSSSEFELSLEGQPKEPSSDSEFELSLDVEGSPTEASSDSEFELTLDDSGSLAPIEEEKKDILETDFEVPALDDEAAHSATGESDTDIESSDFDIALEEGDAASEDAESGSQVVALDDEEEADEQAETVARPRRGGAALEDEEVDELLGGEAEAEGEEELVGAGAPVAAEPAPWGPVEIIPVGITAVVLFLLMFISYEQIKSMWGYHTGGGVANTITRAIGGMFTDLPKE